MFGAFSAVRPDVFPTWVSIRSIIDLAAPVIVLAVGLTVVLNAGEFDLAFPGAAALVSVVTVQASASLNQWAVPILVGLVVGVVTGLIGGALVAMRRAGSFIVTIALSAVWTALSFSLSHGGLTIPVHNETYLNVAFGRALGIPFTVYYAAALALAIYAMLRWTVFGRYVRAIGSNPTATRLSGVNMSITRVGAFTVMGFCAAAAGVIITSRAGQYSPQLGGGLFIPPFVAVFFGTSVLGARTFNVFGSVVGALFIGVLQSGLNILGASGWLGDGIIGVTLIVTLMLGTGRKAD